MYNKVKFQNKRRWQGKEEKKIICFNYRKPGHIVAECPRNKGKPSTSEKPYKKKALKATWDSESESDKEVDTAHMCFMANDNTNKVTPESSIDDCELSMDELVEAFEELSHNYDFLKKKYLKMKKENETLNHKIFILTKEKDDLFLTLTSTQKDFDAYKIYCKAKFFFDR